MTEVATQCAVCGTPKRISPYGRVIVDHNNPVGSRALCPGSGQLPKQCAWKDCTAPADAAREGSGPFDDDLCAYHDEIQDGDPPYKDATTNKENA